MSYYQLPDHTHIADVSLQRSDRGYAVTADFVTLPERGIDEPYTDTRTWHVESLNLWRDLGSAGWAMDHYDRLVDGHRIHAEPSVGSTQTLPEMLAVAASRAHACASDSERQAHNDIVELRAQLRENTHPSVAAPATDVHDAARRAARLAVRDHPTDPRQATGGPRTGPASSPYRPPTPGRSTEHASGRD
ncbi:hypothetical protein [Williamsia muralis]|uniref:hypothetical protein n=1 Tax=Williamsia marianensis TaxID=85044 RepID=UPI00381852E6